MERNVIAPTTRKTIIVNIEINENSLGKLRINLHEWYKIGANERAYNKSEQ